MDALEAFLWEVLCGPLLRRGLQEVWIGLRLGTCNFVQSRGSKTALKKEAVGAHPVLLREGQRPRRPRRPLTVAAAS